MRYALIKISDGSVVKLANDVAPNVQTKPDYKWLPCAEVIKPVFDNKTEIIEGPTYTVGALDVTEVWTKRALTAQEISDRKDASVNFLNGGVYKPLREILLVVVNDIRATRSKLNALIDATGQSATVAKYPSGQVTQIDIQQLNNAIKALL